MPPEDLDPSTPPSSRRWRRWVVFAVVFGALVGGGLYAMRGFREHQPRPKTPPVSHAD